MTNENKEKVRLSFSYPEEMKEKLMLLAKKDNRTLAGNVKLILDNHIEKIKGRR